MKRWAEIDLANWYSQKKRKPLVLRGARQVGKSTLVRQFAKNEKLNLVEINFETVSFRSLKEEVLDVEEFILEIESKFKIELTSSTLLFLDEIQKSPQAFMMLRYFYEKKSNLAVIAAGSLLEFIFESENLSVPVGRIEYYYLGPMSFGEYLLAVGEEKTFQLVKKSIGKLRSSQFDILQKRLHEYLYVGGMPEAVLTFAETQNIEKVNKVHSSILATYRDDFPKYAKKSQFDKVTFVHSQLHRFIGRKMKYSELCPDYQSKEIRQSIELLEKAQIITRCFHSNAKDISLKGSEDHLTYKIYYLDVGLLNHLLKTPWEEVRFLYNSESIIKGLVYEQFVAQHLAYFSKGKEAPELYYWLRDKKSNLAEVDFVFQYKNKIIPIEVKSGATAKLKSLHQFLGERKLKKAIRFDSTERTLERFSEKISTEFQAGLERKKLEFELINLHFSQIEFLENIIEVVRLV